MDPPASASPVLPSAAATGLGSTGVAGCLLAHGAGGHKDHAHILDLSALLTGLGLAVVRFNFPYRDRGKGPPDPMPVLMETVSAVAASVRAALAPKTLILAGHSMGGRAASMAVAEGLAADGLLLFSYPWHPPGKPSQVRKAHLPGISVPVLCFTGTRDGFCERKHLGDVFKTLPEGWTQAWVEGADHALAVRKKDGRTRDEVMGEIRERTRSWLAGLGSRKPA